MSDSKFRKKCCFNCTHHRDYHNSGKFINTLVCSIKAGKVYTTPDGNEYLGIDYNNRMAAETPPCDLWQIDTNIPKGFKWSFSIKTTPQQLTFNFK